ncbi:gamma-glutamylcyclotransferase [bacterium]|jgi:gamma-glutamylaminecyclotransferase|nr:gamma-glutamylcyclotransferase [bacterium]
MDRLDKVFVYGSLKSGGAVRGLNQFEGATIVGKAKTLYPDYNMIDLGSFPGVTKNGEKHIQGEVWQVDEEVMGELDKIEGYPNFYNREVTQTSQGKAWMYYLEKEYSEDLAIGLDTRNSSNIEEVSNTLIWTNNY